MQTDTALALLLMVVAYAAVSGLVKRWYIAPALIFMLLGTDLPRASRVFIGWFGPRGIEPGVACFTSAA